MNPTTQVAGRKRDASRDDDLCRAALDLLVEVGYDRLTVDAVAARAGAGKATVYRRWASKAELVVDAVSRMKAPAEEPGTGSLRGDLTVLTCHFEEEEDPLRASVVAGLVSGLVHDARLREVFAEHFIAPRKAVFRNVFERAVERGEIPPSPDFDLLMDVVPSMVFHRVIMQGLAPDAHYVQRILDRVILPLLTGCGKPGGTVSTTLSTPSSTTSTPSDTPSTSSTTPSRETRQISS